ncbi:hypothetical protein SAMN04488005_2830 [Yoonia tamlensis]|uniref:Cysteine rich repeat-containing protein n=1 Tax=Yoonia tamlensis TaxID=390270 RepID=A0A1I6HLH1_9RHOB|nr:hypothetical protein [Yoonia tamlensis]SFR55302.1 hypothetical protein SAMN04488005_2830 [Yoonia tamlensis]
MFKSVIAGITALSLTFATAMPAQANGFDRDDVGKIIIGIAALAALNAAIENNRRDRQQPETPQHPTSGNNQQSLPQSCMERIDTRYGEHRMLMRRCLQRNDIRVRDLPNRCEVRLFTDDGPRNGFDPACLRQAGYRIDRRH